MSKGDALGCDCKSYIKQAMLCIAKLMTDAKRKTILVLLLLYGVASLIHFIHNAEFLAEYPNLPSSWTRTGVYLVWLGITAVGASGWLLIHRGFHRVGLVVVAVYAIMGLDR